MNENTMIRSNFIISEINLSDERDRYIRQGMVFNIEKLCINCIDFETLTFKVAGFEEIVFHKLNFIKQSVDNYSVQMNKSLGSGAEYKYSFEAPKYNDYEIILIGLSETLI